MKIRKAGFKNMKEKLYMIPLNDAVNADDECPFCHIERQIEQDLMDFVLGSGSSYMESDVRDMTDRAGFCRTHFRKMFQYGNTLGNGWILKTHYRRMIEQTGTGLQPGKILFQIHVQKGKHRKSGFRLDKGKGSLLLHMQLF